MSPRIIYVATTYLLNVLDFSNNNGKNIMVSDQKKHN